MQTSSKRDLLKCLAVINEGRVLFRDGEKEYTAGDLLMRIAGFSRLFPAEAESENRQILITVGHSFHMLAAIVASWLRGYNAVTLSDVAAKTYVFSPADYLITDHSLNNCTAGNRTVINTGDIPLAYEQDSASEIEKVRSEISSLDPSGCRITELTSGSTGEPKRIVRTLPYLEQEVTAIYDVIKPENRDDLLVAGTVPCYHSYGLLFRLLFPLFSGITAWAQMLTYQEEINSLSNQKKKLILVTSPGFLKRTDNQECQCRIRLALSAGGALSSGVLAHTLNIFRSPMLEILGSTETGVMAYRFTETGNEYWNGFPDSEIVPVKEPENGESILGFRSRHCDIFNATLDDGTEIFRTEDVVEMTGPNRFILHGRKSRTVKIEDNRISLDAVEKIIQECQLIKDAAAVALKSCNREYTAAMVVLSPEGSVIRKSMTPGRFFMHLRSLLTGSIPAVAVPRSFIFVEKIPLTPTGKTDYVTILQEFKHEISAV